MNSAMARTNSQDASALVQRWRRAAAELDVCRLEDLRALGEREAARRFSILLRLDGDYPLRPSSGLVEQQRIFDRLREKR